MPGQHGFVSAHNGNAGFQGACHNSVGSIGIVYQFYNETDLGIVENIVGIVCNKSVGDLCLALFVYIADAYVPHGGVGVFGTSQNGVYSLSNSAETEESYLQCIIVHFV